MKKLFLLLALVGMVATACEDDGVNEPTIPEDKTQPIKFIDNRVKALCVVSWDTNGDAELSYEEAAAVTDIGTTFKSSDIISFTELAYFTGLSYIANEAFLNCGRLEKIELPHNITSIGDSAFAHCTSLTSVTIGNGVTSIGQAAFCDCDKLTSVTIPDSVTVIGEEAFIYCDSLTSVTIPDSVTSIGTHAFAGCDSLTSVTIPDSITSIGDYAFSDCLSLTSVTIPYSVTEIGDWAFYYCTSLTSVTIPDSVTKIGDGAFHSCESLTSVYCKPTTPPSLGEGAFKWYDGSLNFIGCTIYVPAASVEAYKSAAYWSHYASDIVGYEF